MSYELRRCLNCFSFGNSSRFLLCARDFVEDLLRYNEASLYFDMIKQTCANEYAPFLLAAVSSGSKCVDWRNGARCLTRPNNASYSCAASAVGYRANVTRSTMNTWARETLVPRSSVLCSACVFSFFLHAEKHVA